MSEYPIVAKNLTRHFGKFVAVDSVSFQIPRGAIFGFLGPNGSGKSTVIRMLCGLLKPTSGTAELEGLDVCDFPEEIKRKIGYTSQKFSLYQDLTVFENMTFFGKVYGISKINLKQRIEELLELMELKPYLSHLSADLSGGWKQRLAVACSLLQKPSIVFLDEPTAGIDPVARRDLWDLLFHLSSEGTTFFVTTHYMDEAERCTHVGYIYQSKLMVCGTPEELKKLPDVSPVGQCRYELSCSKITQVLDLLRKHSAVTDATLYGQTLHLLVQQEFSSTEISHYLEHLGYSVTDIHRIPPTLEDVFVMLTRKRNEKRKAL